mmetsp:Transcript_13886/g.29980  ORF Transcript_13886/g.29980 Transcript_13886/m.29980 type:complete len:334 (+) Transcript_13886:117-1118(+)|eukprot:CAMPEP_0202905678 /NCGR_PEP_ID=MMETSP1392-20130828/35529_1 /ASSEMBLY_ACC=CAM_ASM_000868 /TAXON_ID=225041 /ORGANISM="Chlamydomonas chlamydogama, Strain SAG 11-48b" /LENGTH=333 /DNA_ID=CAMNT_0049593889 /DNA_START=41 /DNA_END=1042 /DNA_ORIENTATION=-
MKLAIVALLIAGLCASSHAYSRTILDAATKLQLFTFTRVAGAGGIPLTNNEFEGTIFLPLEAAWSPLLTRLGMDLNTLLRNQPLCAAIVNYHMIPQRILRTQSSFMPLPGQATVTNLPGQGVVTYRVPVIRNGKLGDNFFVQGVIGPVSQLVKFDNGVAKGVYHVISAPLVPDLSFLLGPAPASPPLLPSPNVYSYIATVPALSWSKQFIDIAGLSAVMSQPTFSATLFLPTNDGWALGAKQLGLTLPQLITRTRNDLLMLLQNHVVNEPRPLSSLPDLTTLTAANLIKLYIRDNLSTGQKVVAAPKSSAFLTTTDTFVGLSVIYQISNTLLA